MGLEHRGLCSSATEQMIRTSYEADNVADNRLANGDQPNRRPDGIHDFLLVLSDVHSTYPDLWQDPALRCFLAIHAARLRKSKDMCVLHVL